jgi:hypothetical protein
VLPSGLCAVVVVAYALMEVIVPSCGRLSALLDTPGAPVVSIVFPVMVTPDTVGAITRLWQRPAAPDSYDPMLSAAPVRQVSWHLRGRCGSASRWRSSGAFSASGSSMRR